MTLPHVNDVALVGRLSGEPTQRTLPSGDVLVTWRLVVERPPGPRERTGVDTIACVSFEDEVRGQAADWRHGGLIEARGSLRRRFWRAKNGAGVDRCEVLVREARLLAVASGTGSADGAGRASRAGKTGQAGQTGQAGRGVRAEGSTEVDQPEQ